MKTLVTGGAGFIGSHLVDLLLANGHDVQIVDNLATGKLANLNPNATFSQIDIRDSRLVELFMDCRPEVVFHEAAQMSVKVSTDDPLYDAQVNVVGLVNVLNACVAAGVRKIVFASSGATYGNPHYLPLDEAHPLHPEAPYGISKMVGEHYLRYYGLDKGLAYAALRYGNVYGPRQDSFGEAGVIAIFVRQLLSGETPVIHWDGEQTRDYVYVADVARANLLAALSSENGCYCVGTGIGTSVNSLYWLICAALGKNISPHRAPRRPGDLRAAFFDISHAKAHLGWEPYVTLQKGLETTITAIKSELTARS